MGNCPSFLSPVRASPLLVDAPPFPHCPKDPSGSVTTSVVNSHPIGHFHHGSSTGSVLDDTPRLLDHDGTPFLKALDVPQRRRFPSKFLSR